AGLDHSVESDRFAATDRSAWPDHLGANDRLVARGWHDFDLAVADQVPASSDRQVFPGLAGLCRAALPFLALPAFSVPLGVYLDRVLAVRSWGHRRGESSPRYQGRVSFWFLRFLVRELSGLRSRKDRQLGSGGDGHL